nr:MAG TPA: hypothetical protein [Caudoviricetes sp.]
MDNVACLLFLFKVYYLHFLDYLRNKKCHLSAILRD